jgi:hypothetical protein
MALTSSFDDNQLSQLPEQASDNIHLTQTLKYFSEKNPLSRSLNHLPDGTHLSQTLKHLPDDILLSQTQKLALDEKEILTRLLWHIKEIERRRLFSKLKFQSINEYVEKELGYSKDEAWRRVAAARLLQEMPEIEEKISTGELNLTNIGLA